ncbi:MAG: dihydrolipoyl dehydrogenase [Gammaproteobacteria bacterium]|nr:dihydrolipoyl dehydrogenase [Gammaproteobacteria bacterium]
MQKHVDVAIIGAGSAGLSAVHQVRRFTDNYLLVDGGELGTTCARVGCMPSKVLIQVAEDFHRRNLFEREGINNGEELSVDSQEVMEHVQDLRDTFVDMVFGSMEPVEEAGKLIESYAKLTSNNTLEIDGESVIADNIIIATGSTPVFPEAWKVFADRIITTDDFFEMETLPESMAIIGMGVIGLELGQSLNRLGVNVVGIDQQQIISDIKDPAINKVAIDTIGKEMTMWLGAQANIEEGENGKLKISAGDNSTEVNKVLLSIGRVPNLKNLGLENTTLELDARGIPVYNPTTAQCGDSNIFIAGDVNGSRPILHEAGHEGRVAGINAAAESITAYQQKTPMAITFSEPNICTCGLSFDELDEASTAIGEVRMGPVGRALIMGKNKGLIRIYAEKQTGKLLGASLCTSKAESLIHMLTWAIQNGQSVQDLLAMPFYHPVLEEALQAALYDLYSKLDVDKSQPVQLTPVK